MSQLIGTDSVETSLQQVPLLLLLLFDIFHFVIDFCGQLLHFYHFRLKYLMFNAVFLLACAL